MAKLAPPPIKTPMLQPPANMFSLTHPWEVWFNEIVLSMASGATGLQNVIQYIGYPGPTGATGPAGVAGATGPQGTSGVSLPINFAHRHYQLYDSALVNIALAVDAAGVVGVVGTANGSWFKVLKNFPLYLGAGATGQGEGIGFNSYYSSGLWYFGTGSSGQYSGNLTYDAYLGSMTIALSSTGGNADDLAEQTIAMTIDKTGLFTLGNIPGGASGDILVTNGGTIKSRTAAQLLGDLGVAATVHRHFELYDSSLTNVGFQLDSLGFCQAISRLGIGTVPSYPLDIRLDTNGPTIAQISNMANGAASYAALEIEAGGAYPIANLKTTATAYSGSGLDTGGTISLSSLLGPMHVFTGDSQPLVLGTANIAAVTIATDRSVTLSNIPSGSAGDILVTNSGTIKSRTAAQLAGDLASSLKVSKLYDSTLTNLAVVTNSSGYVGIGGISNPTDWLEIRSSANALCRLLVNATTNGTAAVSKITAFAQGRYLELVANTVDTTGTYAGINLASIVRLSTGNSNGLIIDTNDQDLLIRFATNSTIRASIGSTGLTLSTLNAGSAGDFLVSNSGNVVTRTAANVLSDIGACATNDSRLNDARAPTTHYHSSLMAADGDPNPALAMNDDGVGTIYTPTVGLDYGQTYNLQIENTGDAYNATPEAGISFAVKYTSSGNLAGMGGIKVGKENTTDSDLNSYLAFQTRGPSEVYGGVNNTERMRLTSGGVLEIKSRPLNSVACGRIKGPLPNGGDPVQYALLSAGELYYCDYDGSGRKFAFVK